MDADRLARFLSDSVIARTAGVEARIVIRRFESRARALDSAVRAGRLEIGGTAACELVAGGTVLARGTIVEQAGTHVFVAEEVEE